MVGKSICWTDLPPNPFVYEEMIHRKLLVENYRTSRMPLDVSPVHIPSACICGDHRKFREYLPQSSAPESIKLKRPIIKLQCK